MTATNLGRQSFLIVFDFDDTVVNCNTDRAIPEYLGRGDYQFSLMKSEQPMQWTQLMDSVVAPFTRDQLVEAAHKSVVMDKEMPAVFRYLIEQREANPAMFDIAIASDANLLFIEHSIAAHIPFARSSISQIHSNSFHEVSEESGGATAETRRCRLVWYEPNGHDCPCCLTRKRPNMCKSRIITRLLHSTHLVDPTIIFIGDGANDFCPILNLLRPRDYMFARRNYPIHEQISSPTSGDPAGCCGFGLWRNATELLTCFQSAMDASRRLPTLTRFRDVGPREFRSITLLERIPNILERLMRDNAEVLSNAGREALVALVEATRQNGPVAVLPGLPPQVPAWLAAWAAVPEFDAPNPKAAHRRGPIQAAARWGQMPWLHGEVYFYNLVAQYVLLAKSEAEVEMRKPEESWRPNLVTPYATSPPIVTGECKAASSFGQVQTRGVTPSQHFNAAFIAREGRNGVAESILLADSTHKSCEATPTALIPSDFFHPYRDYFSREKCKVLDDFFKVKIVPMLACVPWEASDAFVDVLIRWMLWGNGIDLSMFTLEQLQASHSTNTEASSHTSTGVASDTDARLAALRAAEEKTARAQDAYVVGNDMSAVAELIRHLVKTLPRDAPSSEEERRSVDIVMDNVGVECVADLIFSLWLLRHHPTLCVTLHVKCMSYYVSDVTPPDFDHLLHFMESAASGEATMAPILFPFMENVREAFRTGRLRVDADPVWTQPCEYRELPPRVVNTFFYTQRVRSEAELCDDGVLLSQLNQKEVRRIHPRSALVIFKGDLNFRRLLGDRHWDARAFFTSLSAEERAAAMAADLLRDTPSACRTEAPSFQRIVSAFWPVAEVPVCAVRTVKSELSIGIPAAKQDALDTADAAWKVSGKYGVVLLADGKHNAEGH